MCRHNNAGKWSIRTAITSRPLRTLSGPPTNRHDQRPPIRLLRRPRRHPVQGPHNVPRTLRLRRTPPTTSATPSGPAPTSYAIPDTSFLVENPGKALLMADAPAVPGLVSTPRATLAGGTPNCVKRARLAHLPLQYMLFQANSFNFKIFIISQ